MKPIKSADAQLEEFLARYTPEVAGLAKARWSNSWAIWNASPGKREHQWVGFEDQASHALREDLTGLNAILKQGIY